MTNDKGQVVYGLAFGRYLLCGAGYQQKKWAELCQNLKVGSDDYFWWSNDSKGKILVPSDVLAEPGCYWDDRGYLSALSEQQARGLNEDGRYVYADKSSSQLKLRSNWNTADGKRPATTSAVIAFPSAAQFKNKDGDAKADWPARGRAEPFAAFAEDARQPEEQSKFFTSVKVLPPRAAASSSRVPMSSGEIKKEVATPTTPDTKSQRQVKQESSGKARTSSTRTSHVSLLSDEDDSAEEVPAQPLGQTVAPAQSNVALLDTDEFRLIRQTQKYEDAGMFVFANYVQRNNLVDRADTSMSVPVTAALSKLAHLSENDKLRGADAQTIIGSVESAAKLTLRCIENWLKAKQQYGQTFDEQVGRGMQIFHEQSAYNVHLTDLNRERDTQLISKMKDAWPDSPVELERAKAIFEPGQSAIYDVSQQLQGTDEYLACSQAHLPGADFKQHKVESRRYDPTNPNHLDPLTDTPDEDLLAYLDAREEDELDAVNPFPARWAQMATQKPKGKAAPPTNLGKRPLEQGDIAPAKKQAVSGIGLGSSVLGPRKTLNTGGTQPTAPPVSRVPPVNQPPANSTRSKSQVQAQASTVIPNTRQRHKRPQ